MDDVSGEKQNFFFNLASKFAQCFLCNYFCSVNTDLVNNSSLIYLQSSEDLNLCKVHYTALMPQYLCADKTHYRTCAVDMRQLSCEFAKAKVARLSLSIYFAKLNLTNRSLGF